jgi:Holliday junction resolvasome RuvABC DNA-binding subunit
VDEAITALQVLGYLRKDIEKALEKIDLTDLSLEDIIKKGLVMLSK